MSLSAIVRGFYGKHPTKMDDWQLIQCYLQNRSESAFHTLVERHAGLVYGSALRQTGDPQLAQDVAQAVFILLARKAGVLRQDTVVSGWLFQTTRFVAARALRSEKRRQQREQEAYHMQQLEAHDDAWRRMAPVLDEALDGLGTTDRNAILLRYLEGMSLRQVGTTLGVTEDAAKKRVNRALERLRHALGNMGVRIPSAVIVAALASQASASPSASLISNLSVNALGAKSVGSNPLSLVNETLEAWRWALLKWGAGIGTGLTVGILVCLSLLSKREHSGSTSSSASSALVDKPPLAKNSPPLLSNSPQQISNLRHLRLKVVSALSGEPISNAPVLLSVWRDGGVANDWNLSTDAKGECDIDYQPDAGRIDLGVIASGWTARYATWPSEGDTGFPSNHLLRLTPVTNLIGGVVRDLQGRPVEAAEIWFQGNETGDSSHRIRPRERFGFAWAVPVARTDRNGQWLLASVPPLHPGFQIEARHPAFADTLLISSPPQQTLEEIESHSLRQLWRGALVSTMNAAYSFQGRVVDEKGVPIHGAKIQHRDQSEVFQTDAAGDFQVPKLGEGPWSFTVTAEGFGPVRTNAVIGPPHLPMVVQLRPGGVLRLRVVDENGLEVPEAEVGLEQWGEHRHDFPWSGRTDVSGRLEWSSAPPLVELELFARKEGFCYTRDVRVQADGQEHTLQLHRTLDLFGRVVDAETGRGIRSLKAVPGYGRADQLYDASIRWNALETVRGTNGLFKLTFEEKRYPWQVRISAEGYEDWTSGPLTNRISATIEVRLKPSRPQDSVRGIVLKPDGWPASGAHVALLTFEHNVTLRRKRFEGDARWITTTGPRGEFSFPPNPLAHSVAATDESGYLHQRVQSNQEAVNLRLEEWGRVEGTIDELAAQFGVSEVYLYDPAADNYQGRVSLLNSYLVKPDANRRFIFESVPPGEFSLFINSGNGIPFHHQAPITIRPGETYSALITEKPGTRVTGRFVGPEGSQIAWTKAMEVIQLQADQPPLSAILNQIPNPNKSWRALEFWSSAAGRQFVNSPRVYAAFLRDDGTFGSVEPLPPGRYRCTAMFKAAFSTPSHLSVTQQFVVSDDQPTELRLGDLQLR